MSSEFIRGHQGPVGACLAEAIVRMIVDGVGFGSSMAGRCDAARAYLD